MVGEPGTDAYGYPLTTADKRGLVSLLRHRRYADLSGYVESFQADFEADFRKEYWPIDALDAFDTADPSLEPLLEEWAKEMPGSFAPHAARGMYFVAVGWSRRGTRWAAETSEAQFAQMRRYHTRARDNLQQALALRPKLVAAYRRLIGIAMAATSDPAPASCSIKRSRPVPTASRFGSRTWSASSPDGAAPTPRCRRSRRSPPGWPTRIRS